MRRVRILRSAEREIQSADQQYRDEDAPEAADAMLLEIKRAEQKLASNAHTYPVVEHTSSGVPIRRIRLWKFPYTLVYIIDPNDTVLVFAFPHAKQDRYWVGRIK